MADNGCFATIGQVMTTVAPQVRDVQADLKTERSNTARSLIRSDLPRDLRAKIDRLAEGLRTTGLAAIGDTAEYATRRRRQAGLGASHVIGAEDLTAALWLRADLDDALVTRARTTLAAANRRTTRVATQVPDNGQPVYTVATALSYDTGFDAGRIFGDAGIRRVAIGFGAFMADDGYMTRYRAAGQDVVLPGRLSARYLRTALVARGFIDGYRTSTGRAPDAFHFLGLGAPIMIPLVALAAQDCADISFDATSPIRDALEETVYTARPVPLKLRTWRIIERLARGGNQQWRCPCRACRDFTRAHPFDYERLQRTVAGLGRPVAKEDLRPRKALAGAAPLLRSTTGRVNDSVFIARMTHNHWVLERVVGSVATAAKLSDGLAHLVQVTVDSYASATTSPQFAAAVTRAAHICAGRLDGQ